MKFLVKRRRAIRKAWMDNLASYGDCISDLVWTGFTIEQAHNYLFSD